MAENNVNTVYVKGEMDTSDHDAMWSGFMGSSSWLGLIVIMIVGYLTFTLAIGMNWAVSLGLLTLFGLATGLFMGFGSAWIATVFGLVVLAVVVQGIISFVGFFL